MKHNFPFIMYYVLFWVTLDLRLCSAAAFSDFNLFSNLPSGPYKLNVKHLQHCDNKLINVALRVNEKSRTRIKGNISLAIPVDDTIFMEINISFKNLNSSQWKENVINQKFPKLCSMIKSVLGSEKSTILNVTGMDFDNCPIKKGFYVGSDIDTSSIEKMNIPKSLIYGTYKIDFTYTRRNQILGRNQAVIELLRI